MYIAIEGIDTAGKSTQIGALKQILDNAIFTQEPSSSSLGKEIRNLILSFDMNSKAEFFLFLANRAEHIQDIIIPNIQKTIISDRSAISGMSYAKDISDNDIIYLNKIATANIFPDKVVILTLDKNELEQRLLKKQDIDKIELRGLKYLLDIQDKMIYFCKKLDIPHMSVNANIDKEEITQQIINFIKS